MSIRLRELYEQTKNKFRLKLIAGEEGLDHVVSWVYQIEDIAVSNFLYGSELVITTGFASSEDSWYKELIIKMADIGVSGIILNTGRYIDPDVIPNEIMEYGNKLKIPVFVMPWEMHIVELIREYCGRIFASERCKEKLEEALKKVLFSENTDEETSNYLEESGIPKDGGFIVADIEIRSQTERQAGMPYEFGIFDENEIRIVNFFNRHFKKWNILHYKDMYIVMIQTKQKQDVVEAFHGFTRQMGQDTISIGYGEAVNGHKKLRQAQRMANAAMRYAKQNRIALEDYEEMGMNQILMLIEDKELLQKFCTKALGTIQTYDAENHTNFLETLKLYISCSGSVQKTADESFSHRNTVNYRMKKVKDITGKNLEDYQELFQLYLAFLIEKIQ